MLGRVSLVDTYNSPSLLRHDGRMPPGDRFPLDSTLLRDLLVSPDGPLARLTIVEQSESTNSELAAAVAQDPAAWPAPALLVAEHQVAGRGRAGRVWETPARAALTCSLLTRPLVLRDHLSWLPLLAGLATVTALRSTLGVHAVVKWPNDVLVPTDLPAIEGWGSMRKIAGILTEALPDGGVIIGVGINVSQASEELPVPTATSLSQVGAATTDRAVILTALAESTVSVLRRWNAVGGDVVASGLADEAAQISATIGSPVRVVLSDGATLSGVAKGYAGDGALLVEDTEGVITQVHSGDVYHLRLN
jgi:BirA family transcriptional regulator, biotin operon repressor / biotin---[acetyl-CoA-carboxylase] ligase